MSEPGTSHERVDNVSSISDSDDSDGYVEQESKKRKLSSKIQKTKVRKFVHKYRTEWESTFSWLGRSKKGDLHFFCKSCGDNNKGGLSAVKKHEKTEKHIKNFKLISSSKSIVESFKKPNLLESQTKEGELRIAAFIAEHNIAFRTADHLTELIKSVCPDSNIAKKISCDYTKCTSLINNALGKTDFEDILNKMKTNKFSILVDESTDRTAEKHLAVVVRTCTENHNVEDELLCLLQVTDSTAVGLYTSLVNFFKEHDIPYLSNMVGFAADGTNTMMGAKNSLQALLKKDVPRLFIMKCVCHSLALCASYACGKIPDELEDLVKSIYSYFKYSSKRQIEFKEFQKFVEVKPHKLLRPCQTRWLSLHACISRVLEQWSALQLYFQGEYLIDEQANNIFQKLTLVNKLYLQFLDHIIPILTNINLEFQSEKPKVHYLYNRVETAYKTILDFYIEPKYFRSCDVTTLQYRNPSYFNKIENVYFGVKCMSVLADRNSGLSQENIDTFRVNCLNFYVECAHQIYTRFPFKSNYIQALKELSFLDPKNQPDVQSLCTLAQCFDEYIPNLDVVGLDREWRQLRNTTINIGPENKSPTTSFWREVQKCRFGNDEEGFPILNSLVSHIFTLPHSSAAVERIFSAINLNKTKIRNKLGTKSLSGILHTKNLINKDNSCCHNFKVKKTVLDKHNNQIYQN